MFRDFKPEIKLFLLVASIAVVISVGTILFLRELSPVPTEPVSTVQQTPPPAPSPQPQPEVLNASDWQTYRNDEFGFEVKYPNGWEIREEEFSALEVLGAQASLAYTGPSALRLIRSITFSSKATATPETLEVRVDIVRHFKEYPLSGYQPPEYTLPLHDDFEDFNDVIAGEGVVIRKKFPNRNSFTLGTSPIIRNDIYFYLIGKSGTISQPNEKLLLQILATFRFVE